MIKWRKLKEYEKPDEAFSVDYCCFEEDDKEKQDLETYYAICLDVGMDSRMLVASINLNGYNKETLFKLFYYYTGKFLDELSEDDLTYMIEYKNTHSPMEVSIRITQICENFKISDMIRWINIYLKENLISKAIDEIKKIERNFNVDLKQECNKVNLNTVSKLYSSDLNLLCEGINRIPNITDDFKNAVNEIIRNFNAMSQYKVPYLN